MGHPVFVIGTRAQLIKIAPVIVDCERRGQQASLLLTGQHKETMQDLIEEFGIATMPEGLLDDSERATVLALVAWAPRALWALARRLRELRRQHAAVNVAVHGDTLSTLLGAMAAKLAGARVMHIESGLSSGRLFDPFPEELTRQLVFRLSDVAFCPGEVAARYMAAHRRCRVVDTGENTIVDSVRMAIRAEPGSPSTALPGREYLVVSIHRFQNLFNRARLLSLVETIASLAAVYDVFFVLHPATRKKLESEGLMERLAPLAGMHLTPRLGYRAFLRLASNAACVLTDGGSNQEELAVLGVPTLVMRERTERSDGLGRNAVMEADIPGGVLPYLRDGGFRALRRAAAPNGQDSPSSRIAAEMDA